MPGVCGTGLSQSPGGLKRWGWEATCPCFTSGAIDLSRRTWACLLIIPCGMSFDTRHFGWLEEDAIRHSCPEHSGFCPSLPQPVCPSVLLHPPSLHPSLLLSFYSLPLASILPLCRHLRAPPQCQVLRLRRFSQLLINWGEVFLFSLLKTVTFNKNIKEEWE